MVVVIGGGATGLGVAWDLVNQGVPVTVVDQTEIGQGTSGRFHGLLHSGARYAVREPRTARLCWEENKILQRIAPHSVQATGGYFVTDDEMPSEYEAQWLEACHQATIPVREVSLTAIRQEVPGLTAATRRAYWVPDGVLEGFRLLRGLMDGIVQGGGSILQNTAVARIDHVEGVVSGIVVEGPMGRQHIACDSIINAAGPGAHGIAQQMGDVIPMQWNRGAMLVFAHRKSSLVVNRLGPPSDGDILVPHQRVSIFGTTDDVTHDPTNIVPTSKDVEYLMKLGTRTYPDMPNWRILRAFVGIRPLVVSGDEHTQGWASRDFRLFDHGARGGIRGAFSITGGKWTTYRKMGEIAADAVLQYLDQKRIQGTQDLIVCGPKFKSWDSRGSTMVCECEEVSRAQLAQSPHQTLYEWRRATWLGMGPCQGTFCGHRATLLRARHAGIEASQEELRQFRRERDRGMAMVLWGSSAQQAALQQSIRRQTLGEQHEGSA